MKFAQFERFNYTNERGLKQLENQTAILKNVLLLYYTTN